MNGILPLVLGAVVLMAGCLAPVDPGTGDEAPGGGPDARDVPRRLAWDLTGCRAVAAFFDVPAERVEPLLPDGFEPLSTAQAFAGPDAPNPAGDAGFGMQVFVCDSGTGLDGRVEPMVYGDAFAPVQPPEGLRDPDADFTFVKPVTVVPDAPRRDVLAAWGAAVVDGDAAWETFEVTATTVRFAGTLTVADGAAHRFEGAVGPSSGYEGRVVEWSPAGDGLVRWEAEMRNELAGLGRVTVDVAEGTLAAEVLGAGPVEGVASAGLWSYVDGAVERVDRG